MANNAVKGSRAGTALRNIFNGLLGSVTLTADAFGQVEYSAVNADGSMKGLMETVRDLRGYFGQMTESEQVKNAMDIAGMRGYNGLLAILNATDEDFQNEKAVSTLAETALAVYEYRDRAAQGMADLTEGLTEQMEQFVQSMEEEISALDLSEEAKEYGRLTVQSYVDAATSSVMSEQVRNAYAKIALAARLALAPAYSDSAYYANRVSGYASGTDNAPPGYAWVGEKGPELMYMHGGEQIIPAEASRRLAEDYAAYRRYTAENGDAAVTGGVSSGDARPGRALEVSTAGTMAGAGTKLEMHFHIEAGASPETVDAWQEYARSGALKATVLEVMEDAEADRRRRDMV